MMAGQGVVPQRDLAPCGGTVLEVGTCTELNVHCDPHPWLSLAHCALQLAQFPCYGRGQQQHSVTTATSDVSKPART
jgi:hypothetical protein